MLTIAPTTSFDRSSSVENRSSREVRLIFFALLFNLQHLPGQRAIRLGHPAVGIVSIDALALGADLRSSDGARDLGIEDLDLAAIGVNRAPVFNTKVLFSGSPPATPLNGKGVSDV